ncbi:thioredoxin domain-containing protein 5 homolog [Diachasma alloeum]|uniref:thioredoxin domain-containing protein 5 homolog n=1 Tax=Diachasma alloeum TaxID=454923 RepID=UPI0007381971|nr:thioredoxin domain-containing protein 5 homolog [Diachasma alloeum]
MFRKTLILLAAALMYCHHCAITTAHEDDVHTVQYTEENFSTELPKKNHFIMFYAPWCEHCRRLGPTWEMLAEMLNEEEDSRVRIAKVDCTTDSSICSEHDVTGYPTLKFFKTGESTGTRFRGTRDLPSLSAFINEQLGSVPTNESEDKPPVPEPVNGLVELTGETFNKHVSSGSHFVKFYAPWCGHCQKLAFTWDKLAQSNSHDDLVSISKVDCTQHRSVCEQFDIKGYPTLLWIEDGKKVDKYSGERSEEQLQEYVNKMLKKRSVVSDDSEEQAEDSVQSVFTLTGESFKHGIEKGVTFIKFFAPWCGHCKRLAPTWENLGKKFIGRGDVRIVKVDCTLDTSKKLCDEQEVDGFPTLFLYKDGEKISEYSGSRTLDDLYEFVDKHLRAHDEL